MNKKFIYLFLALALPGLIFIFLKRFGKNEFDIKSYYQHSADSLNAICNTRYINPYTVPDSVLGKMLDEHGKPVHEATEGHAYIMVFGQEIPIHSELNRLTDTFEKDEYSIIRFDRKRTGVKIFQRWSDCVFFLKSPWDIVLVDGHKSIRGYYAGNSREEFDRLILEMKILLKKY